MTSKTKSESITSTVAKTDDGTVQITFTINYSDIKKAQEETIAEYAKTMTVPGFRPGKAPLEKVAEKISQSELIEHSLGHILPKALANVINEQKLKIAIYPKFELLSAEKDKVWQIRATTCVFPEVNLGDYKKTIGRGVSKEEKPKELSREEKEQQVIKMLLDTVNVKIPTILIEEEVNHRLSSLIERTEKLGLSLESYLSSLGKKPETLREEYKKQASTSLALDFILNKIADENGIKITEKDIAEAIKASSADPKVVENLSSPEQRRLIESILRRRSALDSLVALL